MSWGSVLIGFMLGLVFNTFAAYLCRGLVIIMLQHKELRQVEEFNKLMAEGHAAMEKMRVEGIGKGMGMVSPKVLGKGSVN